jgi:hypothetical protein
MGATRISAAKQDRYDLLRSRGWSKRAAAKNVGVSYTWAKARDAGLPTSSGHEWRDRKRRGDLPALVHDKLPGEARAALEDISLFALRYFGLTLNPWQVESAQKTLDLLATEDEEYLVVNCPPGSGKSTFYPLVLAAWLTCRDRTIRGLIGSASQSTAKWYLTRLRTAFERTVPVKAKPSELRSKTACDARSTLSADFGTFRPGDGQPWSSEAITVEQTSGVALSEKEATWQAFGRTTAFLGIRVDIAIWDDVYDPQQMKTVDAKDGLKRWWAESAETRLEPGGLLVLQGQRMDGDDIYRYALDQKHDEDDERPKYSHIVYPAHDEAHCKGEGFHRKDSPAWPEGCLLAPRRLPMRKLATIAKNTPTTFEVSYQQRDVAASDVLVPRVWVTGGTDDTGESFPGCLDGERGLWECPATSSRWLMVATVDPSPTQFWSVQAWLFDLDTSLRHLIAHHRAKMSVPDFLEYRPSERRWVGVAEEWQQRSRQLGRPIQYWIVEQNAFQRALVQGQIVEQWRARNSTSMIGHTTGTNKSDPRLGVGCLAPHYRFGRVRLPWRLDARPAVSSLIEEVTRWPGGRTDDCVMSQWFGEWNLSRIAPPEHRDQGHQRRPSWVTSIPRRVA